MWTDTIEGRAFIKEVSKDVVHKVSPEEDDLFDELWQEYMKNPEPPLPSGNSDIPLGFGLGYDLAATTPAVIAMANAVISHLLTEFIKATKEETSKMVKKKFEALFKNKTFEEDRLPLTEEQLRIIKRLAKKQATKFGCD